MLYIFWFLHQTTTKDILNTLTVRCISFDSYIKPQPRLITKVLLSVVYLLIPTSNHNIIFSYDSREFVVYLLIPTSNHNYTDKISILHVVVYLLIPTSNHNVILFTDSANVVVYLLIPTSNHNWRVFRLHQLQLYIFWFLHQTTTYRLV